MNKTAIVTGSSSGIGASIARHLGRRGYRVVVNYAGRAADANAVATEITQTGGQALAVKADVSHAAEMTALFDAAEQAFGPVTVLVNNAGRAARKALIDFTDEEFAAVVDTNVRGAFNALREGGRRVADGGSIVNISMSYQGAPIPGYGVYSASKAAVEQMTITASRELGPRRIRVNAIRPGPTRTPLFLKGKSPEMIKTFEGMAALGRLGEPDDIARVVTFLVGEDGAWVTGQCLGVNGGYW
jgi:3-oxoacyl-[acyl-carrier protein] reductase